MMNLIQNMTSQKKEMIIKQKLKLNYCFFSFGEIEN
jgi:hypothetical protein